MFVIVVKYIKPLEEVDRFLGAHRQFLARHYDEGNFLLSGRREPRTGGVILAHAVNRSDVESLLQDDPFFVAGVAEYEIMEFTPNMADERLSFLIPAV